MNTEVPHSHHCVSIYLIDSCIGNHKPRPDFPFWNQMTSDRYEKGHYFGRQAAAGPLQTYGASCKDRVNVNSSCSVRDLPAAAGGYGELAKKDAWTVKITLISRDYEPGGEAGAILQREDVIGAAGSLC